MHICKYICIYIYTSKYISTNYSVPISLLAGMFSVLSIWYWNTSWCAPPKRKHMPFSQYSLVPCRFWGIGEACCASPSQTFPFSHPLQHVHWCLHSAHACVILWWDGMGAASGIPWRQPSLRSCSYTLLFPFLWCHFTAPKTQHIEYYL